MNLDLGVAASLVSLGEHEIDADRMRLDHRVQIRSAILGVEHGHLDRAESDDYVCPGCRQPKRVFPRHVE